MKPLLFVIAASVATPVMGATYPKPDAPWPYLLNRPPTVYAQVEGQDCVAELGDDLRGGKGGRMPMCEDVGRVEDLASTAPEQSPRPRWRPTSVAILPSDFAGHAIGTLSVGSGLVFNTGSDGGPSNGSGGPSGGSSGGGGWSGGGGGGGGGPSGVSNGPIDRPTDGPTDKPGDGSGTVPTDRPDPTDRPRTDRPDAGPIPSPVPLPASFWMLVMSLGSATALFRRRRT